jgi:hypothetical protein
MAERLATVLFVVLVLLALPQPALAARPIVVGNGTPASCTEMALKHALIIAETVGGATIRFRCGPVPVTIALIEVTEIQGMPVMLVLPNNTTIDGDGLITLDGTHSATVVFVDVGSNASLKQLAITNGHGPERFDQFSPGAIANFGTLAITKSSLSGNTSAPSGRTCGSIWNTGTLTIHESEISDNVGNYCGGVVNEGALTIHNTIVADNSGTDIGGGLVNTGALEIAHSTFLRNLTRDGVGGAITNVGTLTIKRSLIAENVAVFGGGGIFNTGTLNVDRSAFADNAAAGPGEGGGISNWGVLTVHGSTFSGNHAGFEGGGIFTAGPLTITKSTITQNTASAGGGIFVCVDFFCQGTLSLKKTDVTENTPDDIFP